MAPVQARRERRLAESKQHMLQREVRIANLDLWRAGPRASAEPVEGFSPSLHPVRNEEGGIIFTQAKLALARHLRSRNPCHAAFAELGGYAVVGD